jgi:hypothetical protein
MKKIVYQLQTLWIFAVLCIGAHMSSQYAEDTAARKKELDLYQWKWPPIPEPWTQNKSSGGGIDTWPLQSIDTLKRAPIE